MARRDQALDGLRALAALSVLAFHVWLYRVDRPQTGDARGPLDHALFEMNLGLVCFFVLSGFLLYRGFARAALGGERRADTRRYAVRRMARIVPAYYVCLAGCLILFALVGYDAITPQAGELPVFLVFGQNFSMSTIMQANPVTWTLAVEVAFYIVLPLIGALAFVLGPRRIGLQAAMLVGLIAVTVRWNHVVIDNGWNDIARKALPAYIGHFALGMLVALWIEHRRLAGRDALGAGATAVLAALGAAIVIGLATVHETAFQMGGTRLVLGNLPAALGFALIIAAVTAGRGRSVGWLAAPPLAAIGVVSYGIYLWHLPLLLVIRQAGALPEPLLPRMLVVLTASITAGWLSWRLVEAPAIGWASARTRRGVRGAPAQTAPAPARSS